MYEILRKYYTVNDILQELDQEQIWEFYLGFPPIVGKPYLSPIREESNPSAIFFYGDNGTLLLHDFGRGTLNVWQFLALVYELSFRDAVQKVAMDFKLGSSEQVERIKPTTSRTYAKVPTQLQIKLGKWTKERAKYWLEYGITPEIIQLYQVIPIDKLWVNGKEIRLPHLSFSYEFGNGVRKIYCPNHTFKFLSNVPSTVYSGYSQLPDKGDLLLLTSSHKDVMVWRRLGIYSISNQTESPKISPELLTFLKHRFTKIYINYDNDEAGKQLANSLQLQTGFPLFFTDEYPEISEYVKHLGLEQTMKNMLKWEIIK